MKMRMPAKIIIGILTAWVVITPLFLFGAWFFFIVSVASSENPAHPNPGMMPAFFLPVLFLIICTAILHVCLQSFYLVHIILNKIGTDVVRAVLGVGMVFLPVLSMPIYYFIYILPENPPQWAITKSSARPVNASSSGGPT